MDVLQRVTVDEDPQAYPCKQAYIDQHGKLWWGLHFWHYAMKEKGSATKKKDWLQWCKSKMQEFQQHAVFRDLSTPESYAASVCSTLGVCFLLWVCAHYARLLSIAQEGGQPFGMPCCSGSPTSWTHIPSRSTAQHVTCRSRRQLSGRVPRQRTCRAKTTRTRVVSVHLEEASDVIQQARSSGTSPAQVLQIHSGGRPTGQVPFDQKCCLDQHAPAHVCATSQSLLRARSGPLENHNRPGHTQQKGGHGRNCVGLRGPDGMLSRFPVVACFQDSDSIRTRNARPHCGNCSGLRHACPDRWRAPLRGPHRGRA
jgi:hypothetical protein